MNIKQAKEYIEQTVLLYLKKDEYGEYRIPVVRQRPVFLLGAPGVGKTAIMEQIAADLGIALVSYSMTHHTRQSALGLPFIVHEKYGDEEMDISKYTMSEIIATIYKTMEESGIKEGILFLDEINCVSETLSPSMLQFLQYKTFGEHKVPEGWVIVTAGNPPEYNKSVREFDIVTLDRLKVMKVEPDYDAFKEYAKNYGLHNAIINFLELKKDYFYRIETKAAGKTYVTARGWEDLSTILKLYEEEGLKVSPELIGQYLRNDTIVREFAAYYDLYNKYKRDYDIEAILSGNASEYAIKRATKAAFDERLSLLSMLTDSVMMSMKKVNFDSSLCSLISGQLKNVIEKGSSVDEIYKLIKLMIDGQEKKLHSLKKANAVSVDDKDVSKATIKFMSELISKLYAEGYKDATDAITLIKQEFNAKVIATKEEEKTTSKVLKNVFDFVEKAFADGNEMLKLVTELTVNESSSIYIGRFGSREYDENSKKLSIDVKIKELNDEIDKLL